MRTLLGNLMLFSFLVVVAGIGISIWNPPSDARALQLTPLSAEELNVQTPGTLVMVTGQVSEDNRVFDNGFVVYDHGCINRGQFSPQIREHPPFWLQLPTGSVQVRQQEYHTYRLLNPGNQHAARSIEGRTCETFAYRGLVTDEQVVVIGSAVPGDGGNAIQADAVYSGSYQELYDISYRADWLKNWLAPPLLTVGIVAFIIFFFLNLLGGVLSGLWDIVRKSTEL